MPLREGRAGSPGLTRDPLPQKRAKTSCPYVLRFGDAWIGTPLDRVAMGFHQLRRDAGFTDAPASAPGSPGMWDASCSRTDKLYGPAAKPTVPGWTAGPASVPAKLGIPTPEFCALGTVTFANAGAAVIASANTIALEIFMMQTSVCRCP
jgi:hypothetical protein